MFKDFGEDLRKFVLSNVAAVDTKDSLTKHLAVLERDQLSQLAIALNLIPAPEEGQGDDAQHQQTYTKDFLMDLMVCVFTT